MMATSGSVTTTEYFVAPASRLASASGASRACNQGEAERTGYVTAASGAVAPTWTWFATSTMATDVGPKATPATSRSIVRLRTPVAVSADSVVA